MWLAAAAERDEERGGWMEMERRRGRERGKNSSHPFVYNSTCGERTHTHTCRHKDTVLLLPVCMHACPWVCVCVCASV